MEESGLAAIGPVIAGDAGAFELLAVARPIETTGNPNSRNGEAVMKRMEVPPAGRTEHSVIPSRVRFRAATVRERSMGLRPTKTNGGASGRYRGINNLDRAFNRTFPARIPETVKHLTGRKSPSAVLEIP